MGGQTFKKNKNNIKYYMKALSTNYKADFIELKIFFNF